MPVSRQDVARVCTVDEFTLYRASLRRSLAGLSPASLRTLIDQARRAILAAPPASERRARRRRTGYLNDALSRFERRLQRLQTESP